MILEKDEKKCIHGRNLKKSTENPTTNPQNTPTKNHTPNTALPTAAKATIMSKKEINGMKSYGYTLERTLKIRLYFSPSVSIYKNTIFIVDPSILLFLIHRKGNRNS